MTEATPVPPDSSKASRQLLWLIAVCFLLSGFAALLYETVWLRRFAIVLGTSEQALAVILASYMGGLAAGAWLASKWVSEIRRPVWTYGLLELGIAGCAVAMPWGLELVEALQVRWFGGASQPPPAGSLSQTVFDLVSCFGLILLPTAMMGATLPLLAKQVIHRNRQIGPRVGMLYGINTFGAAAGTLTAAFWLLPQLGLRGTTLVGAAVNGLVFLAVWIMARGPGIDPSPPLDDEGIQALAAEPLTEPLDRRYRWVLWFAAMAGAVAFCYEIVFTRMLSHLLGGSIFAFATMLAGFLLGIALGGSIASRFAVRRDHSVVVFAYAQCLAGITALLAYHSVNVLAGASVQQWGGQTAALTQVGISILVLLPTATCIGATFPLATRILARDQSEAATASARVYLWNTVGGILGALLTGIVLLPALAYEGTTLVAIAFNVVLAITLAWWMKARFVHVAAGCLTCAALIVFAPSRPESLLRVSALDGQRLDGDMIFSKAGRGGTVVLFDHPGTIRFFTNGLPEAVVGQRGMQDPFASSAAWLAALPPLLHPQSESMLIVGLGGGVAAAHVPPSVKTVDVFELEPAVVEANEFIRDARERDPLADPRVTVVLNDGRNGLALTAKQYDLIVSQPSHPWTAGASHLYTREFARTVRARLKEGGVFLQWMNVDFISVELFRSLTATLLEVFPHLRVYEPFPGNLLFTASDRPIRPEAIRGPLLDLNEEDARFYREFGIQSPTHLMVLLRMDEPELRRVAEGASIITDEFNLLAMRSPGMLRQRDASELVDFLDRHSPFAQAPADIRRNCPSLQPVAAGMRLMQRDSQVDLDNLFLATGEPQDRTIHDALVAKADGRLEDSVRLLKKASAATPGDSRSAFLLLAYHRLGTFPNDAIGEDEAETLSQRLSAKYRLLMEAVEAIVVNDLASVQRKDAEMSAFGIDEIGYELAVRMRVLWRMTDAGPQRREHNEEALELIATAIPLLGADALIPFRVAAAIGAEKPDVALTSAVAYARSVVDRIEQGKVSDLDKLQNLRSNLIKSRTMLEDLRGMPGLSQDRYRDGIVYLDKVISGRL